jgi:hypothetical protein
MTAAVWRYLLTAIALFALFVAAGDAFDRNRFGDTGVLFEPLSERSAVVTAVLPHSHAATAGVRPGDRITADWIRRANVLGRNRFDGVRAGEVLTFRDERLQRNVTVIAERVPLIFSASRIIAHVLRIVGFLFALILFWNFSGDRAARALGGFLLLYNLQGWGNTGSFAFGTHFSFYVSEVAAQMMLLMLVLFACWFPERHPIDSRRGISIVATAFTVFMVAFATFAVTYTLSVHTLRIPGEVFRPVSDYVAPAFLGLLLVAAVAIDFRTASPLDRLRLEWLTLGMVLTGYSYLSITLFPSVFYTFGGGFNVAGLVLSDIGETVGTLCILYGFLRYRVLDLTFAVSQATVYALLSSAIVAAFILVEYLVGKYVEAHSHVTGAIITLAFALALGIGLRALHRHVDRFADRIIFRSRYHAEEALRSFGRRASFFTNEKGLQDTTVAALTEYARAQSAAIYLSDVDGDYTLSACCPDNAAARISHEDPVVLALKDDRRPQFIPGTSRVDGELAFPMFVRGELMGFVSCGKRRVRETYAPDEVEAMNYALEHVGVQLDAIRTERLQTQIREIQQIVSAYHMLGADPARVLAQITTVSGVKERGYEETTPWKTLTRAAGRSAPKTSSTT